MCEKLVKAVVPKLIGEFIGRSRISNSMTDEENKR